MKYRNMAKHLTKEEAQILLWTLVPDGILTDMKRIFGANCVEITFIRDSDPKEQEYGMTFLPEVPEDIPEDLFIPDFYAYTQFTIAKGYHTAWLGNLFVEHKRPFLCFRWLPKNKGRRCCQSGER